MKPPIAFLFALAGLGQKHRPGAAFRNSAPDLAIASLARGHCAEGFGNSSRPALLLANSAPDQPVSEMLGLANALSIQDDGWALIPYGETIHDGRDGRPDGDLKANPLVEAARKGVVQRFNREDADLLVANFRSLGGRVKRAVFGLNVYRGHPDAPRFAKLFPDKSSRGTIADMEARDQGMALRFVLNEEGTADVESGWDEFSPYWETMRVGTTPDGRPIVAPRRLRSVGLIPKGNMPGLTLANLSTTENAMNKLLQQLLASLGYTVAADASETTLAPIVATACSTLATANAATTALTGEKATLSTKVTQLETERATLNTANASLTAENGTLKTRAENAQTAFAAERKERSTLLVDAAVSEGRVAGAERDGWITALCNAGDFTAKAAELAALKKGLKTTTTTDGLKKNGREIQERQDQVLTLVNAALDTAEIKALPEGDRYDAAWAKTKAAHPALFEQPAKA